MLSESDIYNPCKNLRRSYFYLETEVQVLNVKNMFDDFVEIILKLLAGKTYGYMRVGTLSKRKSFSSEIITGMKVKKSARVKYKDHKKKKYRLA